MKIASPYCQNNWPILHKHLRRVKTIHEAGLKVGYGAVHLPYALERKFPNANKVWAWQNV